MEKCSFAECHRKLEFLPFTCKFCGHNYCDKHRLHRITQYVMVWKNTKKQ